MLSEPVYNFAQEIDALVKKHPELVAEQLDFYDMTREEKLHMMWRRIKRMMEVKPEVFTKNSEHVSQFKWTYCFSASPGSLHLHQTMFT